MSSSRFLSVPLLAFAAAPLAFAADAPKAPAGPRMHSVTFLGTSTGPALPVLGSQLGLPEGEGLVVLSVAPDSPVSSALQVNDVLTKLDDQILVNPPQLAVLVRAHAAGDSVSLTYVRQGKPGTVSVKLGSHEVPDFAQDGFPGRGRFHFISEGENAPFGPGPVSFDGEHSAPNFSGGNELFAAPAPAFPGQVVRIERRDGGDMMGAVIHAVRWDTANGRLTYSDDDYTYDLDIKEGKKTLKVTDSKGTSLFSGPIDTPEERSKVPAKLLPKLDGLERSMHHAGTEGFHAWEGGAFSDAPKPDALPPLPGSGA